MGITVSGKLNKPAEERATENGVMFLVNVGKKERDRKNNSDIWANYSAALFAKQGAQADFYRNVLQKDCIVTVSGTGIMPRIWGNNFDQVALNIVDSKLEYGFNPSGSSLPAPAQQTARQAPQQQYQQPAPQQPAPDSFDDGIPF